MQSVYIPTSILIDNDNSKWKFQQPKKNQNKVTYLKGHMSCILDHRFQVPIVKSSALNRHQSTWPMVNFPPEPL